MSRSCYNITDSYQTSPEDSLIIPSGKTQNFFAMYQRKTQCQFSDTCPDQPFFSREVIEVNCVFSTWSCSL